MAISAAPHLRVREVDLRVRASRMRIPFHFGDIQLTACPQVFARVRVELADGASAWGVAAELMVPRWFDKRAGKTLADNIADLQASLEAAALAYLEHGRPAQPFALFEAHYAALSQCHKIAGRTGLSGAYGQAVLDRAVIDGCCKALKTSFFRFAAVNGFGLRRSHLAEDLADFGWDGWLGARQPLQCIEVRHTVGLDDALAAERDAEDGLPVSLASSMARYGLRLFKVKMGGDVRRDLERLEEVRCVVDRLAPAYQFSLDGNEQYRNPDDLATLVEGIERLGMAHRLLYIEQPLAREHSFDRPLPPAPAPYLMDEADDSLSSFVEGQRAGWTGVSAKGCKGIYKSMLNAARCAVGAATGRQLFMSAEDLSCQAGIAVQQDLAIAAFLGLAHAERNGHHFGRGLADMAQVERDAWVSAHPDLYAGSPHGHLKIEQGRVHIGSLDCTGFGSAQEPAPQGMRPLREAATML